MEEAIKAISSPTRLRIIEAIGAKEVSSGAIGSAAGCSPSATSQHLKVLRDAGLVLVRVDAKRRLYRVDFERLAQLRAFLDSFWSAALAELKSEAEGALPAHSPAGSEPDR